MLWFFCHCLFMPNEFTSQISLLKNGPFSDLNGFYRPKDAARVCEADPACGGFTFKGTSSTSGLLSKLKFQIYFFHFFPAEHFDRKRKQDQQQHYHWTSYKVRSRNFVRISGYDVIEDHPEIASNAVCLKPRYDESNQPLLILAYYGRVATTRISFDENSVPLCNKGSFK